jgi:hypothetical protein
MTTDSVLETFPDAPSFRRRLSTLQKTSLSQKWMNERLAGLSASDFREADLVVASARGLHAPCGFEDTWKKIEHIDSGCVTSVLMFLDLENDAEMLRFARVLSDLEVLNQKEHLRIVIAHHSTALSKKGTVQIDRNRFGQFVGRDIAVIATEPVGLELALLVRSKFLTARSQCKKKLLFEDRRSQDRRNSEAVLMRNAIWEMVWTYLRQRLDTGIPPESSSIPVGIPTKLGNATLGSMLGEGAWGKVFTLTDPDTGVSVLKCIAKSQHTSLRSIKCLKNEISVMQRLSSKSLAHPNIVRLHDIYSSSSHVFLQLEHGGPETLAMRLKRRDAGAADDSVSLRDAVSLVTQCADALNHLHSKAKVAHRDLKTENIIFSATESGYQIKVADFGLASVCGSETICYSRAGTFVFIAPEVILGDGYNACIADVWSMGMIFLEILCFLHFPDTVLFRRRRNLSEEQAMEQVCARLGTSESIQELFQTYVRLEYRVKGILKSTKLRGMLNVVPSDRSMASDVFLSCAALLN